MEPDEAFYHSFTTLSFKNDKAQDVASLYQKSPFLEIESRSALRIKALSMSRDEQEGLFPLSTSFRVTGKAKADSGRWHINLQEIEKTRSSS
ncbi:ADP-ribosyltransferase domain-containing protein [Pseudomonas avellanae]|uniref:ADP-ribosyltransferase domain-containing protein n=1 Tax=Pseudomonas avellanae TaxID=46257 RepID=UPI0002E8A0EA|nr:ADP-ribosyltransferase domain-containing protein [Pseudomonas avellanae]UQW66779.1 ADP-ribosyltransferase domain-containing protein [Pseudomonas avellanae]UQW75180.1 ADP-ribosyltransferase domain-containing protein [Pseudomonas avellanae]GGJ43837.1 hypothetical protein GCM10009085_41920 [Pseudomonas avellanae]